MSTKLPPRLVRILDIGCGDGRFTMSLGAVAGGTELYGLEMSHEAVNKSSGSGSIIVTLTKNTDIKEKR